MTSKHIKTLWLTGLLLIALVALPIGATGETLDSEDANFAVEITDLNSPVVAGEPLEVTANITNTGGEKDSQQIHLKDFDDEIVDSVAGPPLALDPGEQQTVSLRWNTTANDVGNGNISVQSNDEYPSIETTITEPETTTPTSDASVESSNNGTSPNSSESSDSGTSSNILDRQHATIQGPGVAIFSGGDIRQVRFGKEVDGRVVATRVHDFSNGVTDTPSAINRYQITPPEAAAESNATIKFQLSTSAVEAYPNETVLVKRWNGTSWIDLPTDTEQREDSLVVEATTTGFSPFVMTVAEPSASTTADNSPDNTRATGEGSTETTATQSNKTPPWMVSVIGGLVALLLLVSYVRTQRT